MSSKISIERHRGFACPIIHKNLFLASRHRCKEPFGKEPFGKETYGKETYGIEQPVESNALGIAGFIVSIVGLLSCGLLSIFAVLLSGIGLLKPPRGFAIAGLIIGFAGLALLAATIVLLINGTRVAKSAFNMGVTMVQLKDAADRIGRTWEEKGQLPTAAEGQRLLRNKNDLWDQPIVYETDGQSFSVRSTGPDGMANTEDDQVEGPFDSAKEAQTLQVDREWRDGQWRDRDGRKGREFEFPHSTNENSAGDDSEDR